MYEWQPLWGLHSLSMVQALLSNDTLVWNRPTETNALAYYTAVWITTIMSFTVRTFDVWVETKVFVLSTFIFNCLCQVGESNPPLWSFNCGVECSTSSATAVHRFVTHKFLLSTNFETNLTKRIFFSFLFEKPWCLSWTLLRTLYSKTVCSC